MILRIRLWWAWQWARHEYFRCADYENGHLRQAIAWGDDRRAWLKRINELSAPVVIEEQRPGLRVIGGDR